MQPHRVRPRVEHPCRLVHAPDGRALPQAPRNRVRLRLDGEGAVLSARVGQPAGDSPREGLAVELQAEVVVVGRRAMLLDDEEVAPAELWRMGVGA